MNWRVFYSVCWAVYLLAGGLLSASTVRGTVVSTENPLDIAIDGPGWFIVCDPATGERFATRRGDFKLEPDGHLKTAHGYRVQGFADLGLSQVSDVSINAAQRLSSSDPSARLTNFRFAPDGKIHVTLSDQTEYVSGQILLQQFEQPQKLARVRAQVGLYAGISAAGPAPEMIPPGSHGLGLLRSGSYELGPVQLSLPPNAAQVGPLAQGALTAGQATDYAIGGNGFFLVRDPDRGERFVTRAGMFLVDGEGYLITYGGMRVQGYSDLALTIVGDVRIDAQGRPPTADPTARMKTYQVGNDGIISIVLADNTLFSRSQILLQTFRTPSLLVKTNDALYRGVDTAGPLPLAVPGRQGTGLIHQGGLELIHVTEDLVAKRRTLSFFRQFEIMRTDNPLDLAISGSGFFQVQNPANGELFATRDTAFHWDVAGYLVTDEGFRVQGFNDCTLTNYGDIQLNLESRPAGVDTNSHIASFSFADDGQLTVSISDGLTFTRGQVLLQNFRMSYLLKPAGNGLYTNVLAAGPLPLAKPSMLGTDLVGGARELVKEFPELVLPSRHGFRLLVTGESSTQCRVQATTNFSAWMDLGPITLGDLGETDFLDPNAASSPLRFYRVLPEPY